MKKLLRLVATATISLGFATGVAAAQSSIDNTGPFSWNKISNDSVTRVRLTNNNNVSASNNNRQGAQTGDAKVAFNTTGGDATSGSASNDNSLDASVSIDNSGVCDCLFGSGHDGDMGGSIDTTGPGSHNKIDNSVYNSLKVTNNNNVTVSNNNDQWASSGDAKVFGNTTGGDATSGDASNSNSVSLDLSISN